VKKNNGVAALAFALALAGALPSAAGGFRDIATVSLDNYFDGSWHLSSENVLLARIVPALTLEAKVAREDASGGWYSHFFELGPVVSFTESLYLISVYGLGVDSEQVIQHQVDLDFNYETATVATSLGLRANWLPSSGYFYFLPSMSANIRPVEPLGLFGKLFVSADSHRVVTGSFWGEADYALSPRATARAGFTLSYAADTLGWSLIGGTNLKLGENSAVKYTFSWFSDTVQYLSEPSTRRGVRNSLSLDVKF
jgi:hypothetical protein